MAELDTTRELRKSLPPLPKHMLGLPLDERGYPVPWFVHWEDGKPDFRIVSAGKWLQALQEKRCFVCGEELGRFYAFSVGPMCVVNRVSAEPPAHRDCAIFAAKACPFLALPKAQRREITTVKTEETPGIMLPHNPGVALVWVTKSYTLAPLSNGTLISFGEPIEILWFAEGRAATRAEILEAFSKGADRLQAITGQDLREFNRLLDRAMTLIPEEISDYA